MFNQYLTFVLYCIELNSDTLESFIDIWRTSTSIGYEYMYFERASMTLIYLWIELKIIFALRYKISRKKFIHFEHSGSKSQYSHGFIFSFSVGGVRSPPMHPIAYSLTNLHVNKPYTKGITQSQEIVWRRNFMEDCVSLFWPFWLLGDWGIHL